MAPKNKQKRSGSGDKQTPIAEPSASPFGDNAPTTEAPSTPNEEAASGVPPADQSPPAEEVGNTSDEQVEAHEDTPLLDPSQDSESKPDNDSKNIWNEMDTQKSEQKPKEEEAKIEKPDNQDSPQTDKKKPDAEPVVSQQEPENPDVKPKEIERPAVDRSPTPMQSPTVVPDQEERSEVEDMPRERSKRRSRKSRRADVKEEEGDEEEKPQRRHRRRQNYDDYDDEDEKQVAPSRPQTLEQRRTQQPLQPTPQEEPEKKGGKQPLRLRLDVNLEVDIELRARIHGDLTLALLS